MQLGGEKKSRKASEIPIVFLLSVDCCFNRDKMELGLTVLFTTSKSKHGDQTEDIQLTNKIRLNNGKKTQMTSGTLL